MRERTTLVVLLAGVLPVALVVMVALFTVVALLLIGGGAVNGSPSELGTIFYLLQAPILPPLQAPPTCALEASLVCLG
jgi:hypothetical protein